MKRNKCLPFVLLLFSLSVFSCRKEDPPEICKQLEQTDAFFTEDFKADYTIQFPVNYVGAGMVSTQQGNTFEKTNSGGEVSFSYAFCLENPCNDFGYTLDDFSQQQHTYIDTLAKEVVLDQRINLCKENELYGIFYYQDKEEAVSRLFWLQDGRFKAALDIEFTVVFLEEVVSILQTIKERS